MFMKKKELRGNVAAQKNISPFTIWDDSMRNGYGGVTVDNADAPRWQYWRDPTIAIWDASSCLGETRFYGNGGEGWTYMKEHAVINSDLQSLCRKMEAEGFTHACLTNSQSKPHQVLIFYSITEDQGIHEVVTCINGLHLKPEERDPAMIRLINNTKMISKQCIWFIKQDQLSPDVAPGNNDLESGCIVSNDYSPTALRTSRFDGVLVTEPDDIWSNFNIPKIVIWNTKCLGESRFYANAGTWRYNSTYAVIRTGRLDSGESEPTDAGGDD